VLLSDDARIEHARCGIERIDRRIDALFRDRPFSAIERESTVVASKWANEVAGAGSVKSSAGT